MVIPDAARRLAASGRGLRCRLGHSEQPSSRCGEATQHRQWLAICSAS